MGSGRDKRKKAKGTVPGQGASKTAAKTEKNESKQQRRLERKAKASYIFSIPQWRLPPSLPKILKFTIIFKFLLNRVVKMILMLSWLNLNLATKLQ
jgi:hypothetical protein